MKITSKPLALVIFIVLFGGIFLTSALNWWNDGSSKIPRTITQGEAAGQYNPADIRGSYTFGNVSQYFNIPLETLRSVFHVPAERDMASFPLKDLETIDPNLSPHAVALFAALYNGLPFNIEEGVLLPSEAVDILKQQARMTPEQEAFIETHTIKITGVRVEPTNQSDTAALATPVSTAIPASDKTITSKTTFKNLLDWGLSKESIEEIIDAAIPENDMPVRDYIAGKGLEFKSFKDLLQLEVNKIK